jgi:hypothetical protein
MIPARPAEHGLAWWLWMLALAGTLVLLAATSPLHGLG